MTTEQKSGAVADNEMRTIEINLPVEDWVFAEAEIARLKAETGEGVTLPEVISNLVQTGICRELSVRVKRCEF